MEINRTQADRMAAVLGLTRRRFLRTYAIGIGPNKWMLRDKMIENPSGGIRNQKSGIRNTKPQLPNPEPRTPNAEQWCIFLERDPDGLYRCQVNDAKPEQCRGFPVQWRNPDSLRTCAGLRRLMKSLSKDPKSEV